MSDSPRFNSPSRKSRFRAQGRGRPASQHPDEEAFEGSLAEDAAAMDMAEIEHDSSAGEPLPDEGASVPHDDPAPARRSAVAPEQDALPAGLRLTRDPDATTTRLGLSQGKAILLALGALAVGGGAGYFFGHSEAKPTAENVVRATEAAKNTVPLTLNAETQAAVEAAFADTKQGRYADGRKRFEALAALHPEWPSMQIEAARAALYERDMQATQSLLAAATRDRPLADAALLTALLHLTAQEYDAADDAFAAAVATDPSRADVYYFWGENLRREGKPQQAAEKFKSAILRNQYENVEPLYTVKYWLSLVQSDQEASSGEGAKINASLASAHPSSSALFAAAAREIKAGRYKEAAEYLTRAQAITDPVVFNVIMRDPTFSEVNMHPEIATFYQ